MTLATSTHNEFDPSQGLHCVDMATFHDIEADHLPSSLTHHTVVSSDIENPFDHDLGLG